MKNTGYTLRILKRSPILVFVCLPGIATGLAAVMLLTFYLRTEFSYDNHFPTRDRVVRINCEVKNNEGAWNSPIILRDAYTAIPKQIPEIEAVTQIYNGRTVIVKSGSNQYMQNLLYVDPGFFEVFGILLTEGNQSSALSGKNKVVLNRSTALKIFKTTHCQGEILLLSDEAFVVSGVVDDLPETTHFQFDLLASMETIHPESFGGLEFFTYFLIRKHTNIDETGIKISRLNDQIHKQWGEQLKAEVTTRYELLKDIHLHTKVDYDLSAKVSPVTITIVAAIAFFIMLIALVNYINLYLLHSEKRLSEISTRKSLGANTRDLFTLFMSETGVLIAIAYIISIGLTVLAKPYFSRLIGRPVLISEIITPSGILLVAVVLLLLILLTGAYPTYILSRYNPVAGFKGHTISMRRKNTLTTGAVVVQFTITVFLLTSLLIIFSQLIYLKQLPLGFNNQGIINFTNLSSTIRLKHRSIKEDLEKLSFVESVGTSYHRIGDGYSGQGIRTYGSTEKYLSINQYRVQPGFCNTLQLQLKNGRFFTDNPNDKKAVIFNDAAVKMLGLQNPIGQLVDMFGEPMEVIGVVHNFYYGHPGQIIEPLVITSYSNEIGAFYIRFSGACSKEKISELTRVFQDYDPGYIASHQLVSDFYREKYSYENRVVQLVAAGTSIVIILSFMGLLALSIYNVNRRTKEIGIRKVSGSSVQEILIRLLRQTIYLVLISITLASIPAYLVMNYLLSRFAERITLHAGFFVLSGAFSLVIALAAVGWQSWKAATRNPVEALRYE